MQQPPNGKNVSSYTLHKILERFYIFPCPIRKTTFKKVTL